MRTITAKKTLFYVVMLGYLSIFLLMIITCIYLMLNYRNENVENQHDIFQANADNLDEIIIMLDNLAYDTYVSNVHFNNLSLSNNSLDEYQNAYYLQSAMQSKLLYEGELDAFFIKYGKNLEQDWYRIQHSGITSSVTN